MQYLPISSLHYIFVLNHNGRILDQITVLPYVELVVKNVFYDLLVRFAFLKDRNAKVASYTNSAVSLYVNSFQKRFSYDLSGLCLCIR